MNRYRSAFTRIVFTLAGIAAGALTIFLMVTVPSQVESAQVTKSVTDATSTPKDDLSARIAIDSSAKGFERPYAGERLGLDLDCLVLGTWRSHGESTD